MPDKLQRTRRKPICQGILHAAGDPRVDDTTPLFLLTWPIGTSHSSNTTSAHYSMLRGPEALENTCVCGKINFLRAVCVQEKMNCSCLWLNKPWRFMTQMQSWRKVEDRYRYQVRYGNHKDPQDFSPNTPLLFELKVQHWLIDLNPIFRIRNSSILNTSRPEYMLLLADIA